MENINNENQRYEMAVERVKKIKNFYSGLLVFAIVVGVVYGVKISKYGFENFFKGFRLSMIFVIWGLILAIKGVKLFFFNSDWENDMINKEIKKQNNGNY